MKSLIRSKSIESGLSPQQLYGLYAMERLILKLSKSIYSAELIVKGGFLLTTKLGLTSRMTRDIDFTIRNNSLSESEISEFTDLIEIRDEKDKEYFEVKNVLEIRGGFEQGGYSFSIDYFNEGTKIPISVDLTKDEALISINENQKFKSIFSNEEYKLSSYTVEQIVVDKFYTLLAYGLYDDTNSRMKDYYDLYIIHNLEKDIDYGVVNNGLHQIMDQRGTIISTNQYTRIINRLYESDYQRELWDSYSDKMPYANGLKFDEIIKEILHLSTDILDDRMKFHK